MTLSLGGALAGCTLDVHGTASIDAGIVGGPDAGMGITIPEDAADEAATEASVDPPDPGADAGMPDHTDAPTACPDGAEVEDIGAPLPDTITFDSAGEVCARYAGTVTGWGISNGDGRMVTIVGTAVMGPFDATLVMSTPVAPGADGFVYWILTPGDHAYVSVYAY